MMTSTGPRAVKALSVFEKFMARLRRKPKTKRRPSASTKPDVRLEAWQQKCYELTRENERLKFEAQDARQQLCQLRIDGGAFGEGAHKRIGYMVGTFIPEGVLDKLRAHPERIPEFQRTVAEAMISSAVKAMVRVNERGKQVAMLFMPYGTDFKQRANLPVFEVPQGHHLMIPKEIEDSIEKELKREAESEYRKLLRY